ncbi:hypothetical protein QCA50_008416 [Cerrena zonata]|uniref:Hydrophobin n=1 Tax=Cerrena zonata TaxID=2478898 RepID=A0AAW0G570_9APHY
MTVLFKSSITLFTALLAMAVPSSAASDSCSEVQIDHLCCRAVTPSSPNSGVGPNGCAVFPADPGTVTGGACSPTTSTCLGGVEVCCTSASPCGSGLQGNNCTVVHP